MTRQLALNDEELRKLNSRKIVNAIDKIGKLASIFKYQLVVRTIKDLLYIILFIGFLFGFVQWIDYKLQGNLWNIVLSQSQNYQNKFICHASEANITFNNPKSALEFKELFPNATCDYSSNSFINITGG